MKRSRSRQEHAIAVSRVTAAVKLQTHRPKVQESAKQYKRAKEKRRWQHDQDGAFAIPVTPWSRLAMHTSQMPGER